MSAKRSQTQTSGLYAELMVYAVGLPNDELFAQMIASKQGNPGLSQSDFSLLIARHFSGVQLSLQCATDSINPRALERDDVLNLLIDERANQDESELWMAAIVTDACMANDHLWQDLGLRSRIDLGRLMTQNFPVLAAKNVYDMKWKKFLYKQLCEKEGINACRAPSCEYCTDYMKCFGPED